MSADQALLPVDHYQYPREVLALLRHAESFLRDASGRAVESHTYDSGGAVITNSDLTGDLAYLIGGIQQTVGSLADMLETALHTAAQLAGEDR